jgi:hypothetical protein
MPCFHVKLPGGGRAIVKAAAARGPTCKFCGEHRAKLLCDFELGRTLGGEPITCDTPVCEKCAKRVGPDKDFCPKHSG